MKQGNGPRDIGISIRGSNARNTFGIRNIVVLEDGFPVTQPDGLSRTDLTDPHAYSGVEVYRGPSSAMFGNYATGGAINFRVWHGGEVNGMFNGVEGGSFGYLNNWSIIGNKSANFEGSIFASDVRGTGFIANSTFNTQTVNSLMTYAPTPYERITLKVIDNVVGTDLPIRLFVQSVPDESVPTRLRHGTYRGSGLCNGQSLSERIFQPDGAGDGRGGEARPTRPPHHRRRPLGA
jgi:iron complex outermembrane receptor protein